MEDKSVESRAVGGPRDQRTQVVWWAWFLPTKAGGAFQGGPQLPLLAQDQADGNAHQEKLTPAHTQASALVQTTPESTAQWCQCQRSYPSSQAAEPHGGVRDKAEDAASTEMG